MLLDSSRKSSVSPSNYLSTKCDVKSKYFKKWQKRDLIVALEQNQLQFIQSSGKKKVYPLDKIQIHQKIQQIDISVPSGRNYQIKNGSKLFKIVHDVQYFQLYKKLQKKVNQQTAPHPQKLNYHAPMRSHSFNEDYIPQHKSSIVLTKNKQPQIYQRVKSYIKQQDWQIDKTNGGVIFINAQKKSMISKLVKYIVQRVISTGSFMGISFPTFGMKPQTILQTYCKCLGAAPLILDRISNTDNPLERIKAFNALIQTISIQFNDIQKPFNPTIGQTFQGQIGGYPVYAQQISHHPPITAILLDGKNYVIHASLQLNAKININSAVGLFYGQIVIQFDDGGVVKGRMPMGVLNGAIFGETKFGPEGAVYSYDPINHLVSSYQLKDKGVCVGHIGKLKQKNYQKFRAVAETKTKQKYQKFKHIPQRQFQNILSKIQVRWNNKIIYNGFTYWDYTLPQNLPIKLTQNLTNGQKLLHSDSSFRADIKLREQNKMEQSQVEKQRIEEEQRRFKKLRDQKLGMSDVD